MNNHFVLIPLIIYLAVMLFIAWFTTHYAKKNKGGFVEEYFIGGRSLGGFVLAMTLIATFVSASSFLSGPGVAYSTGLSWVLLSMIQVPTAFFTLGVLGKKFAIISRRIKAVTVTDYLYARYRSDAVVILSSVALVLFFTAMMMAQFIGGAVLFQTITGYSYLTGLILFGLVVIIYTTVGGFKAVALTDAIQAVVMVAATLTILFALIKAGGGIEPLVTRIAVENPAMVDANATPRPQILSYWILVGVGLLGLPQTSVRCMSFKSTQSMHRSMVIGTVVVGFLMLGMHLSGFLAAGVLESEIASSDQVIPSVIMQLLPGAWAGIFIAGPMAAIMSTVSSLLILASAAIVKDLVIRYSKTEPSAKRVKQLSFGCTAILGVLAFVFAIGQPDLIVWINLAAMGGLESSFFWPTVLGLYWKRANASGALFGMLGGIVSFLIFYKTGMSIIGINNVVWSLLISLVCFLIGTYLGRRPDEKTLRLFF